MVSTPPTFCYDRPLTLWGLGGLWISRTGCRDGYGLNEHLIELAAEAEVDTIITCDNGIAAVQEIAQAKALGMTVIVTDHHEPQEVLPPADALINPKQHGLPLSLIKVSAERRWLSN